MNRGRYLNMKFFIATLLAASLGIFSALLVAQADEDRLVSRLFGGHSAIMLLIDPDNGEIVDANQRAAAFYGMSLDELLALNIQDINALPLERIAELREEADAFDRNVFTFPHRTRHHGVRTVDVYSSPVVLPSGRNVLFSIVHDVDNRALEDSQSVDYRQQLESSLEQAIANRDRRILLDNWLIGVLAVSVLALVVAYFARRHGMRKLREKTFEARKLAIAVDQSPVSIVITDSNGDIEYVNQTCINSSGYSREELLGSNPKVMQSGKTPSEVYASLWATITAGKTWEGRLVNQRKDGSEFVEWVSINPILDEHHQPIRFIAIKDDLTEREEMASRLRSLERYDALTGLANRFSFFQVLDERLSRVRQNQARQALAVVNIDRFHSLNEAHGHEVGDRLLQMVATRLNDQMDNDVLVARLGPDEFAILPPLGTAGDESDTNRSEVRRFRRLLLAFTNDFALEGRGYSMQASVGVAVCDRDSTGSHDFRAGDFMRMVDSALHTAKRKGGNQLAYFDEETSLEIRQAIQLEQDFARAIERDELRLALQAQVDQTGRLRGAEALLRWRHETLGEVSPARFIPIAEETGLIVSVGRWVLEQGLRLLKELQQFDPDFSLSLNISPLQIRHPDFLSEIQALVSEAEVNPGGLCLEITESVFLTEPEVAQSRLEALRKLGVGIAIDDFGTGYSSLSYLKRLPVTELKIDQSFIAGLPDDKADIALVNIIVAAAQQLKLRVVAEGVETDRQASFLSELGELLFQGYFFDKPTDADDWMKRWARSNDA